MKLYEKLKKKHADDFDFGEAQLNNLGYRLLGEGKYEEAVEVFKMNIEAFPQSANTYDSLTEALMSRGESAKAKEYIEAMLEIVDDDPNLDDNRKEQFKNTAKYRLKNME